MAWIVGMSDEEEILALLDAGYTVDRDLNLGDLTPEEPETRDSQMIAVFVDCDVSDLLNL